MKHVVQRSNARSSPSASRTTASLVVDAGGGVEVSSASRWRTTKYDENALSARRPPGRSASAKPRDDVELVVAAAEQAEAALAQADDRVELAVEREVAHVELLELDRRGRRRCVAGERDELGRRVDADDVDARAAPSASACRPGPAPASSTRIPGLEPERVDEEVDLLLRPLGERVAEVRGRGTRRPR